MAPSISSHCPLWCFYNFSYIWSPILIHTTCLVSPGICVPPCYVLLYSIPSTFALPSLFLKILFYFLFILKERGREGEREAEKHPCVRETLIGFLSHTSRPGSRPKTQSWALTGNRTGDLSLCGTTLNPLSNTTILFLNQYYEINRIFNIFSFSWWGDQGQYLQYPVVRW